MRTLWIVLWATVSIAGVAIAQDKPQPGPAFYVPLDKMGTDAIGDDCGDPIILNLPGDIPYNHVSTTCGRGNSFGDPCLSGHNVGEDVVYELNVTSEITVNFTVESGTPEIFFDAGLAIGTTCPIGESCFASETYADVTKTLGPLTLAPGTYFFAIDVSTIAGGCIEAYTLDIYEPPTVPANNMCENPEVLPLGPFDLDGSTTSATNNYDSALCTGYEAEGHDVVYITCLANGATLEVTMTTAGWDDSLYLVLDCADIAGTCVAGSDEFPDGSNFSYTNTSGEHQQLFLIVDGYGLESFGDFTISGTNEGGCEPVGIEKVGWGAIKSLFR